VSRLRSLGSRLNKQYNVPIRLLSFDVTQFEDTAQLLRSLPQGWNEIDVLINNAGKAKGLDFIHEGKLEHWEEMIDTNVKGLLYMTRLIAPLMVERGSGHIINVCSTAGHEVYPKGAVYCATKHAVDAITKGTRLDLHRYGVRVSQVSPAHVEETEFASVRFDGDQDAAAQVYENFQPLRARDVARSIYYIAVQPKHVNVQDVLMLATQQANSTTINRSGR
jgi:NADP-dependent 3-hydroxy acid dehydrogenase YdfG